MLSISLTPESITIAELGVNIAQAFASMGIGVTLAPPLGMLIMQRTGNPLIVYRLRLVSALAQLAVLWFAIPETLERSKRRPVTFRSLNPFRFVAILVAIGDAIIAQSFWL